MRGAMPVSVLLADDDVELSNMLAQYLRRDGFDVHSRP
jgi:DNA-binding response OmpR family regulator